MVGDIIAIYKEATGCDYKPNDVDDRVIIQKVIYLLEFIGFSFGDYCFQWNKFGPYSLDLACDVSEFYKEDTRNENVKLSIIGDKSEKLNRLVKCINCRTGYSLRNWLETIATLHFMKHRLYVTCNDEQLVNELENKKDWLNNRSINLEACKWVREFNS